MRVGRKKLAGFWTREGKKDSGFRCQQDLELETASSPWVMDHTRGKGGIEFSLLDVS